MFLVRDGGGFNIVLIGKKRHGSARVSRRKEKNHYRKGLMCSWRQRSYNQKPVVEGDRNAHKHASGRRSYEAAYLASLHTFGSDVCPNVYSTTWSHNRITLRGLSEQITFSKHQFLLSLF